MCSDIAEFVLLCVRVLLHMQCGGGVRVGDAPQNCLGILVSASVAAVCEQGDLVGRGNVRYQCMSKYVEKSVLNFNRMQKAIYIEGIHWNHGLF